MSKHRPRKQDLGSFGNTAVLKNTEDLTNRCGLVYCRVSSNGQKTEGTSLQTQESECKAYLLKNNIKFEKTFKDSYSGGGDYMSRPAMREMICYIDQNKYKDFVVVFYDLKRFARDTQNHLKLRAALKSRNVVVKCLNFKFDDTPEGDFIETIMAANGELERKQNARQVVQKQRARLINGYRAFPSLKGYQKISHPYHGKIDVKNNLAPFVKEALEGFANMRFIQKVDGVKFLQEKGVISKNQTTHKGIATYDNMLREVFYAGCIEYKPWDVDRRQGHHEPLISLETYEKIQRRLNNNNISYIRRDINEEFSLRGLVNCACCGQKLTAAYSKSKTGAKHPYYKCANKGCEVYGKSIKREEVHSRFDDILKSINPCSEIIELAGAIFDDLWTETMNEVANTKKAHQKQKEALETSLELLTSQIVKTTNETVIKQYERQIEKIGLEIEDLERKLDATYDYSIPCRTSREQVFAVLKTPYIAWKNYDVYQQQRFYSFIFEGNLHYHKIDGYRTPLYALPLRIFQDISANDSDRVEVGSHELET